jgi:hypothetical protein
MSNLTLRSDFARPHWDQTLDNLQYTDRLMPSHGLIREFSRVVWVVALHWLYKKKWASKHRIPVSRDLAKDIEPIGDLLLAALELAIQLHAVPNQYKAQYSDASEWFAAACPELRRVILPSLGQGKRADVAFMRGLKKELSEFQNPFPQDETPHLHGLIQAAIDLSQQSDHFYRVYWRGAKPNNSNRLGHQGFLNALGAVITALDRSKFWAPVEPHGDTIAWRLGKGEGRLILPEKLLFSVSPTQQGL